MWGGSPWEWGRQGRRVGEAGGAAGPAGRVAPAASSRAPLAAPACAALRPGRRRQGHGAAVAAHRLGAAVLAARLVHQVPAAARGRGAAWAQQDQRLCGTDWLGAAEGRSAAPAQNHCFCMHAPQPCAAAPSSSGPQAAAWALPEDDWVVLEQHARDAVAAVDNRAHVSLDLCGVWWGRGRAGVHGEAGQGCGSEEEGRAWRLCSMWAAVPAWGMPAVHPPHRRRSPPGRGRRGWSARRRASAAARFRSGFVLAAGPVRGGARSSGPRCRT